MKRYIILSSAPEAAVSFKGVCSVQLYGQYKVCSSLDLQAWLLWIFPPHWQELNAATLLSRKRCTMKKWVTSQQQDKGVSSQQQRKKEFFLMKCLKGDLKFKRPLLAIFYVMLLIKINTFGRCSDLLFTYKCLSGYSLCQVVRRSGRQ